MAQGLVKIGDLMSEDVGMPQSKGSLQPKLTERRRSSGTTGLARLDGTLAKLTGAAHGGIGACEHLRIKPSYTIPNEEPLAARVARSMNECIRRQDVSLLTEQAQEEIFNALEKLGGGSRSERETRTIHRVMALLAHYPQASKNDAVLEMIASDWLGSLGEYPYFAVEAACKHWLDKPSHDYTPKVHEIKALTKMYARHWCEAISQVKERTA